MINHAAICVGSRRLKSPKVNPGDDPLMPKQVVAATATSAPTHAPARGSFHPGTRPGPPDCRVGRGPPSRPWARCGRLSNLNHCMAGRANSGGDRQQIFAGWSERLGSYLRSPWTRRLHSDRLPAEEIISARPSVNFCLADPAVETAGLLIRMLLLCGPISQTALRTAQNNRGLRSAGHVGNMRPTQPSFHPSGRHHQTDPLIAMEIRTPHVVQHF